MLLRMLMHPLLFRHIPKKYKCQNDTSASSHPNGDNYRMALAYSQRSYKDNGQLWKERDPDGVLTVYIYNTRGEVEYTMAGQKTEPTSPPDAVDISGEHRII